MDQDYQLKSQMDHGDPLIKDMDKGVQDKQPRYHVECNFQNIEVPIFEDGGAIQSNMVDDYESFLEDYSVLAEFDAKYNVQGQRDNDKDSFFGYVASKDGEDSDDTYDRDIYISGEDDEDGEDSSFNVDYSNLYYDVYVDMSKF